MIRLLMTVLALSLLGNAFLYALLFHATHMRACEVAGNRRLANLAALLAEKTPQEDVHRLCGDFLVDYPDDARLVALCEALMAAGGGRAG